MDGRQAFFAHAGRFDLHDMGEGIYLRPICAKVWSEIEGLHSDKISAEDSLKIRWLALKWSLVDENGEPILKESDKSTFEKMHTGIVDEYFRKAMELTNISEEDREAFEKN
jgi:hypothetical protein